ncbi:MAG: hypothetical protein ABI581_02790 [Sediminibacterium sp.]
MAIIKIQRSNEYNNFLRNYGIYVDDVKVGIIANEETKDVILPPGKHELYFKIDWCRSPKLIFDLNDNEVKQFSVAGFKGGRWMMPLAIGLMILNSVIGIFLGNDYLTYSLFPIFLVIVYYITVGRNKYLSLTEIP